jgi:hypothetical protein
LAEAKQDECAAAIAGHFGLAAVVKSCEQTAPLWALMLATVWLDIFFVPLMFAGIETTTPVNGVRAGYGKSIIHADYTHSLVGMVVLSAVLGWVIALVCDRRVGVVVALVSASHWLLDIVVHRGDMPILLGGIGGLPRLGLGLWRYPDASAALELLFVLVGAWLYWRAARIAAVVAGRGWSAADFRRRAGCVLWRCRSLARLYIDNVGPAKAHTERSRQERRVST